MRMQLRSESFPFLSLATAIVALAAALCIHGCAQVQRPVLEDSPVRISELLFAPSDAQGTGEFVEIVNASTGTVDLSGWEVTGPGRTSLPAGTSLPPGESLVLCKHRETCERIGGTRLPRVVEFEGKLNNAGEIVRIEDPQGRVADEVSYDPADPEVAKADGTGQSIHRAKYAASEGPGVWRAGPPTPGATALGSATR